METNQLSNTELSVQVNVSDKFNFSAIIISYGWEWPGLVFQFSAEGICKNPSAHPPFPNQTTTTQQTMKTNHQHQQHRSKKRKTVNRTNVDYHPSSSSVDLQSSSASSESQSTSAEQKTHINSLKIHRHRLRTHSTRVLSPLPPNACLPRKFVHLNRLSNHQPNIIPFRTHPAPHPHHRHHQIIKSRPLCNPLSTNNNSNSPRPNRKRKRTRTATRGKALGEEEEEKEEEEEHQSTNENTRQVMVLIKHQHSPRLTRTFSQSADSLSRSSSQDPHLIPEAAAYYVHHASKPQLLRLRRDQLIQLIKAGWEKQDRSEEEEETEHKNKDCLATFIIDARTNPSKKTVVFPSQSQPSSAATRIEQNSSKNDGQEQTSPQPWPVTRLKTRVKSLPDNNKQVDAGRGTRQNGTISRSRSQQGKLATEAEPAPATTRKTRSATQATSQSLIHSTSSSWCSSSNSECPVENPVPTRTPRRLSNRRQAVKFVGHRSGGPTPVAYRTRRSSNHRSVIRPSVSSKSRSGRGAITPMNRTPTRHDMVTPTRSIRKLRNGKVIPLKRMIGEPAEDDRSFPANGTITIDNDDDDDEHVQSDNDQDSIEDASEDEQEDEDEELHQEEDQAAGQIESECDIDIRSAHSDPIEATDSEDDAFDIAEDEYEEIQIDSDDDGEEDETLVDLSQATSKGLLRLKRDNLVKLCEERELEADGTKKDLVQSLLAWRDTNETVSPSSDVSEHMCPESVSSEVEVEVDPTPTAQPRVFSATKAADGTCSRPIVLDSIVNEQKPMGSNQALNIPGGSKKKSGLQKKDDIGELLDLESLNLQDKEIQPDQLKKLEMIGAGGFKDVYRGIYKKVPVAIAEIRGHLTEMDLKELRILRDLRHENIVRFIGVCVPTEPILSSSSLASGTATSTGSKKLPPTEDKTRPKLPPIMVVTEICTNGDLFDYLRKTPNPGFLKICQIFRDICRGLDYLHSHSPTIIHRDLKSSNVLITSKGVAKLNDFGLARIKNSTRSMVKSLVGTVNWQAPELWVAHPRYNEKVDVYSAGLVLWEMLQWHQPVKRYPFEGQNEHGIYQDVGHRQLRPATAGMRRQWGDEILNLVEKLWAQNPNDRPRMDAVLVELDAIVSTFKEKSSHN
ncbi:hypothetical protein PtA15_7A638 [Puccinia triticina]|uniref:Protein kinase domain-containing protein n=1 Tax=Puccinia triticina TaxID=208348 RepID=A0ABY7CNS5_9BASI|nr:uncharacterized protein PtA15_7A638 [Puccinia triticina]WAQ86909.1 hypothetical protein PtA15_7A638 [Puccinia triticina]